MHLLFALDQRADGRNREHLESPVVSRETGYESMQEFLMEEREVREERSESNVA